MRFPGQREQRAIVAVAGQCYVGTCEFRVEQLFLGDSDASFADHLRQLRVIGMRPSCEMTKLLNL